MSLNRCRHGHSEKAGRALQGMLPAAPRGASKSPRSVAGPHTDHVRIQRATTDDAEGLRRSVVRTST